MFKEKFAQRIKNLRKSRKLTQEQLAELIGVDFRYISLIENAKSFPSCAIIEKLSLALNAGYSEMFDFNEEMNRKDTEQNIINLFQIMNDKKINTLYNFAKQLI